MPYHEAYMRVPGVIWERYGRDEKNHSRAETPLYKGDSEDDGRDEDAFQYKVLWKGCCFMVVYTSL